MAKKKLSKIIGFGTGLIRFGIPIIAIIWFGALLFEMRNHLRAQELSFFFNYAQITLTLFGFTLIGGIFENKKEKPLIVKKLFRLSLAFLSSSISFFFVYSSMYMNVSGFMFYLMAIIIPVFLIVGFCGFIYGILFLFSILFDYLKEIV